MTFDHKFNIVYITSLHRYGLAVNIILLFLLLLLKCSCNATSKSVDINAFTATDVYRRGRPSKLMLYIRSLIQQNQWTLKGTV